MITHTNPEGAYPPRGYHHIVTAEGGKHVWLAGQVAYDENRTLIGGDDVQLQTRAVLANIGHRLAAIGAGPEHVVRITTYVVDYRPEHLTGIMEELTAFFGADNLPTNTLIGVSCLASPDLLVEIEPVAVVP
jgi:enamine deaminase RidA (YjgF/YER057c/UK114 family)